MKGEKRLVLREYLRHINIMYKERRAYPQLATMVLFTRCIRGLGIRNLCSFLVPKETVVLHRWESETCKFVFIRQVDEGRITTVKDLES